MCGGFGRDVIQEMNRLGILIDLSHTSDRTTLEAIELSKQPVAITHANPRKLCDNPRNKTDEITLALAKKGGVIGANSYPEGIRSATEFPNITRGLVERGYSGQDVANIMGGNWTRLFADVWKE